MSTDNIQNNNNTNFEKAQEKANSFESDTSSQIEATHKTYGAKQCHKKMANQSQGFAKQNDYAGQNTLQVIYFINSIFVSNI